MVHFKIILYYALEICNLYKIFLAEIINTESTSHHIANLLSIVFKKYVKLNTKEVCSIFEYFYGHFTFSQLII